MGAEDAADCFDVIIRCISEIIKVKMMVPLQSIVYNVTIYLKCCLTIRQIYTYYDINIYIMQTYLP
jgi:hypothetical protein